MLEVFGRKQVLAKIYLMTVFVKVSCNLFDNQSHCTCVSKAEDCLFGNGDCNVEIEQQSIHGKPGCGTLHHESEN